MPLNELRDAREAWNRMRLEKMPGVFFLAGGNEKRMSTFAQQNRAISLVGCLLDMPNIAGTPPKRVAVVGAGAAGVTAASVLAWREVNAVIYEKEAEPLGAYARTTRHIDPRLYEWPRVDWNRTNAELPLLNWSGKPGRDVTLDLRAQWTEWCRLFGPDSPHNHIAWRPRHLVEEVVPNGDPNAPSYAIHGKRDRGTFADAGFDTVLLALGPGRPQHPANLVNDPARKNELEQSLDSWQWDYWAQEPEDGPLCRNILVFGRGDSGLTRALTAAVEYRSGAGPQVQAWRPVRQDVLVEMMTAFDQRLVSLGIRTDVERAVFGVDMALESALVDVGKVRSAARWDGDEWKAMTRSAESAAWAKYSNIARREFDEFAREHLRQRRVQDTPREVAIAFRDQGPYIDGKAFPLHRWLFAQLVRLGWVRLREHCDVERLRKTHTGWTIEGTHDIYDQVLFGLVDSKSTLPKLTDEFHADLERRNLWSGHGPVVQIARRQREIGKQGSRVFFSDLFDSTTQARVLQAIVDERATSDRRSERVISDARLELDELYDRRLALELFRRDKVVISDTQALDGVFFLGWIPKNRDTLSALLGSGRLIITRRSGADQFDNVRRLFFARRSTAGWSTKAFEFSSIQDAEPRRKIARTLAGLEGTVFPSAESLEQELLQRLDNPGRVAYLAMVDLQKKAIACLNDIHYEGAPWPAAFRLASALEEPIRFRIEQQRSAEAVAREAFDLLFTRDPISDTIRNRSNLYAAWNDKSDPDSEGSRRHSGVEDVRDFYDRAYNRAVAVQNGATVFETVRVQGLPNYSPSKNDLEDSAAALPEPLVIESTYLASLVGCAESDEAPRVRESQRRVLLYPVPPANAEPSTPGRRALMLLRGSDRIERQWNEEALEVGVRVPAVIDSEFRNGHRLNRVEYVDGIGPSAPKAR